MLIKKETLQKKAFQLLRIVNLVCWSMSILNILAIVAIYLIDDNQVKGFIGFGFFYMTIWVLIPCILVSLILAIYNRRSNILEAAFMKKHFKTIAYCLISFVLVFLNGLIMSYVRG